MNTRQLAVEPVGDRWAKKIKPRIRLMGKWLNKAGFVPGSRVNVNCVEPGVLEVRALTVPKPTEKL